jgi:hypothetical protein
MTHDEMIKIIEAHRDGKTIQWWNIPCWEDLRTPYPMSALLLRINNGHTLRVKPRTDDEELEIIQSHGGGFLELPHIKTRG